MEQRHVQAELAPPEYRALQRAAEQERLTLKEALREAAMQWALRHGGARDPLDDIAGIADGRPDASERVDDIYLEE